MNSTEHNVGLTGHSIVVHKKDHEGVLLIDGFTGMVLPEQHDRPEWAEGLFVAQLTERTLWYTARLGKEGFAASGLNTPEALAFEDLGWLGTDTAVTDTDENDGTEMVLIADDEFRLEILAGLLGANRSADGEHTGHITGTLIEVEVAKDDTRTTAEMQDFRDAQEQGYKAVNE